MKEKWIQLIEDKLKPMIKAGRKIERISMHVSPDSKLAELTSIRTDYGSLHINSNAHVPKGVSYLMEEPGEVKRAFAWVIRKEQPEINKSLRS